MYKLSEFKITLQASEPAIGFSAPLKALWYDGKAEWQLAHEQVDHLGGVEAAWVHAYLHRKEGDIWNADYWYSKAGKVRFAAPLETEWEQLVVHFLNA